MMSTNVKNQPVVSPTIRLFTGGTISVFTFLTAFPAGYILAIINWHRMGNRDKKRSYILGLITSSLLFILLSPYILQNAGVSVIINVALGIQFYNEMTSALNAYEQSGKQYARENFFSGCLIAVAAILAWLVVVSLPSCMGLIAAQFLSGISR